MASSQSGAADIQAWKRLFTQSREPTKRTLVEFYESDWQKISKMREELDLSWKDFFRSITMWFDAFDSDESARAQVEKLIKGGKS